MTDMPDTVRHPPALCDLVATEDAIVTVVSLADTYGKNDSNGNLLVPVLVHNPKGYWQGTIEVLAAPVPNEVLRVRSLTGDSKIPVAEPVV